MNHDHRDSAFPCGGITLREYAAIQLRVPDSGSEWLDNMIKRSQRDKIAVKALQGLLSDHVQRITNPIGDNAIPINFDFAAKLSYGYADAMQSAGK